MPDVVKLKTPRRRCPICGRPAQAASKPFCSPRCRDEDLRRWLGGDYRIPGPPAAPDEEQDR